jgi:cell division transport system permease protein
MSIDEQEADSTTSTRAPGGPLPRTESAIVPKQSIGGRSLVAVVAIMTFLAALTTGGVMLVRASAGEWQSDVAREITIQIRPAPGRDIEADIRKAVEITRAQAGIAAVRPYTRDESERLIEPWLGSGLSLADLPVPRIIVVRLAPGARVDIAALRKKLSAGVPGATLDDHRGWVARMRTMAGTAVAGGIVILLLVFAATVLSVTFATRGAMATNRPIIEVLHFIGAKNGFIAGHFQRHFLVLGLRGGAIGGGVALALFALAQLASDRLLTTAGGNQVAALFGTFSIGFAGYVAIAAQIVLLAAVTALTSRYTVNQTLDTIG